MEKDVDLIAIVRRDRPAINLLDVFLQVITFTKWRYCCSHDFFRYCFQFVLQPTQKIIRAFIIFIYSCNIYLILGKISVFTRWDMYCPLQKCWYFLSKICIWQLFSSLKSVSSKPSRVERAISWYRRLYRCSNQLETKQRLNIYCRSDIV